MSIFSFNIGKEELHTICFSLSRWTGRFKVTVDGKPIHKGLQLIIGSKEIKFEVGDKERHQIWIMWNIPLFGYIRTLEAKVLVDEKFYDTYKF
jgi:hypothetical protein